MEPMVTISLKDYNKLLAYSDMIDEMEIKSKKKLDLRLYQLGEQILEDVYM